MSNRPHIGRAKIRPVSDSLFLPYQKRWVNDRSRLKLMEKGRQIGITWGTGYAAVERTAEVGAAYDQWVSSRDDIQARLFLEDCKAFAKILDTACNDLGERVLDEKSKISAYVIEFATGKRIHSMSSNPDAQAGKRGGRILDEFALHPDPRKLWSIAYPGITWGGSMEVISTHRGSFNFFNQLVREVKEKGNPKGISLHTVTLQTALDEGFLYKLQSKLPQDDERQDMDEADYFSFIRSGCADEESFLQEYMCQPADDASAFLSYDLIASCEYQEWEWRESEWQLEDLSRLGRDREIYIGVDVGRRKDLTVLWVLEKVGGVFFTRKIIELQNKKFSDQERALWPWIQIARRTCIDNTGIGMQLAERAQERFGSYRVEPVTFTAGVKEELAYPFRAAFEDKTIRIPFEKHIRADLRSIKRETTAAGNVRFGADRSEDGHADRFWAGALALHAGKRPTEVGRFHRFVQNITSRQAARRNRAVA